MYCLQIAVQEPKSLYRSRARRHFYGTENEIWAGFGPVCNTEKKWGRIMSNFRGWFFHVFRRGKKIIYLKKKF